MTIRPITWLWLTVCLHGFAAISYRVANFPHFPLRSQTEELVWWIDVLLFNTGIVEASLGTTLASMHLVKRIGNPQTTQIPIATVVLGFITGCLISLVLHTVNPSLYHGWS